MSTPAKKTAPGKSGSLADFLNKDKDKADETKGHEFDRDEDHKDNDEDGVDGNLNKDGNFEDEDRPGSVVVDSAKPVDNQVDKFGNPDGVTFSGKGNVIDKTPGDLATESPAETAVRFGISDEIPDDVHDNPNINVTRREDNYQIPGGTHLHPDIARDNYNRIVGGKAESGQVTTTTSQNVYATEATHDDKGIKGTRDIDVVDDRDDEDVPPNAGSSN